MKELIKQITDKSLESRTQKNGVIKFQDITDLKLYILDRIEETKKA